MTDDRTVMTKVVVSNEVKIVCATCMTNNQNEIENDRKLTLKVKHKTELYDFKR